jgi:electron transfer flavoprotein alpha subunit
MSVLIYIEHTNGIIKKNALEAVSYGVSYGEKMGISVKGVTIGNLTEDEIKKVGSVGLKKVLKVDGHNYVNHQKISAILSNLILDQKIQTVVFLRIIRRQSYGLKISDKN